MQKITIILLKIVYLLIEGCILKSELFFQPMKPMLPRKLTSSARINLNLYWNLLEELVTCDVTMEVQDGGIESFNDDVDMSNEINENLANERLEKSRDSSAICQGLCSA